MALSVGLVHRRTVVNEALIDLYRSFLIRRNFIVLIPLKVLCIRRHDPKVRVAGDDGFWK
jgi:hypothetical protein